jgi:hypothetical protein
MVYIHPQLPQPVHRLIASAALAIFVDGGFAILGIFGFWFLMVQIEGLGTSHISIIMVFVLSCMFQVIDL